jgi:hypothetical protein
MNADKRQRGTTRSKRRDGVNQLAALSASSLPWRFVSFAFFLHFVDHCHISRIIDHLNAFIFENNHLMMHLRREINKEKGRKKD